MISVNNIVVSFGGFTLLNNISFMINPRDRIGLVGKNGAGKSTLLKILIGQQPPTAGVVSKSADTTVGYLAQQMKITDGKTVFEETMTAFAHLQELEQKIERVTQQLTEQTDYESDAYAKLIQDLSEASERYHMLGGDSRDEEIERTLLGLGFKRSDFDRPTAEFSGGWRMRIELAKILLTKPNVILLDEPTNHLDIESIQWLENYLSDYYGAVVLISHDRAFLDNVTSRTVEILLGKVHDYEVPYSKYVVLRKERRERQLAAYENQRKMIEDTQDFINRFRYKPSKSNQVQSRIKQLEKVEIIEIDDEDNSSLHIKFPPAPRSGQIVFEAKDVAKRYGGHTVFSKANLIIERGERVALVGRNGEGKTTLSRILIGDLPYEEGEAKLGYNVNLGYYAQNQDDLMDGEITVLDTLDRVAVGDIRTKLRDILGAFLFRGEDVDKKVKVLSGGERSRLAMARLMLEPHNLLVLDEPTNHMDMRSKDILKSALMAYDGTLVVVSHDREFLDGLVDKVYEFRDGRVREYLGGIYDFLQYRELEDLRELERKAVVEKGESRSAEESNSQQSKLERKEFDRQLRRITNKIEEVEKNIEKLEAEIAQMDEQLANPIGNFGGDEFFKQYNGLKLELEKAMQSWDALHLELEEVEKQCP
ncbi:MAG: ABC-F family ATP-binding cassette domain-containing protein [Prevotellaceae bacterium]|jgi:ATP-binding cassette subfamily F protein 3|nr:ABC-F family ATP-binding cassette domain-containing protein [Prevotellaceae bacterium]